MPMRKGKSSAAPGRRKSSVSRKEPVAGRPKSARKPKTTEVPPKVPKTLAQEGPIRLNRYIANSGVCSRREADNLIRMGVISVNGKVITELGYKVNHGEKVRHEGKRLTAAKPVYLLTHNPKGYLAPAHDRKGRDTVPALIGRAVRQRIHPFGRLRPSTAGLLLRTNH